MQTQPTESNRVRVQYIII